MKIILEYNNMLIISCKKDIVTLSNRYRLMIELNDYLFCK